MKCVILNLPFDPLKGAQEVEALVMDGYASDVGFGAEVLRLLGIIRQAFIILTRGIHVPITSQGGAHD